MKKPAHTPTKSIRGDAQPQEKGKDATTHPASPEAWMQPTAGDAQPQANRAERQERPARTNGISVRTHVRLDGEVTRVHHDGADC